MRPLHRVEGTSSEARSSVTIHRPGVWMTQESCGQLPTVSSTTPVQAAAEGWAAPGSQQMGARSGRQRQTEGSGDIIPVAAASSGCKGLVHS